MPHDSRCPQWLQWAKELLFIAQAGLEYSPDPLTASVSATQALKNPETAPFLSPSRMLWQP
ncbi:MAG: NUDIX hydrolase N-terminal domain-containing protein [Akkermansia sp.]|nr:NUDIX hydrolase N-terminal domain-containing protein [Akkermansia sp.]